MGVLRCCHTVGFLRNPLQKLICVLEHCCEDETNCRFTFLGTFLPDRIPKATNVIVIIHSNISCKLCDRIPINYMIEFRESFEATT
jgi:hypothetical protein